MGDGGGREDTRERRRRTVRLKRGEGAGAAMSSAVSRTSTRTTSGPSWSTRDPDTSNSQRPPSPLGRSPLAPVAPLPPRETLCILRVSPIPVHLRASLLSARGANEMAQGALPEERTQRSTRTRTAKVSIRIGILRRAGLHTEHTTGCKR